MISCTPVGGLGNVLFIIAQCYAYSLKHGVDYCVPLINSNPHYKGQKPYIFPGINYCDNIPDLPVYKEKAFTYEEIPFMDNACFSGYFQSWRYFNEYRQEILKAFSIPYEKKEGVVGCHIRRGDYVRLAAKHPPVTIEYINKAMYFFKASGYKKFIIFSDDIDWCYENIGAPDDCKYIFSEGRTELEDLAMGSSCEHFIGSNSSLSLWMYYLNQNPEKIGAFPATWFGPDLPHDTKDLLLPNCITI